MSFNGYYRFPAGAVDALFHKVLLNVVMNNMENEAMSKCLRIIVIMHACVFFGCSRQGQFSNASNERFSMSFLKHEEQADSVYSTGSVQVVEKKLLALLSTIDEYQAKEPHVFQYYGNRGVAQGRLALLYWYMGKDWKADELMFQSITSFKKLLQHKLKEENIMIDELWVMNMLEIVDEPLDPAWKKSPQK